jgi:hypothetical protein
VNTATTKPATRRNNGQPDPEAVNRLLDGADHGTQSATLDEAAEERAAIIEFDGGLPRAEAERRAGLPRATAQPKSAAPIAVVSARDLIRQYPRMRPPVVHGLVRQGETCNFVSASKVGKSWLGCGMQLSVNQGLRWLDTFPCTKGPVLLIDNELHRETIAHRLQTVADAMDLGNDWQDSFDIVSLRGQSKDLESLGEIIEKLESDHYRAVMADAWYRFMPRGTDENSNANVMALYNIIDGYANHLGAAWFNVHHSTKGDQSGKSITDVGAGAGAQSRAADCHLILRPHEEDGVVVLQAVVRSFPPVEPVALRWSYPLWLPATDVDPTRLKRPVTNRSKTERDQQREDKAAKELEETRKAIVEAMTAIRTPESKTEIRRQVGGGHASFERAWKSLLHDGTLQTAGMVRKGNRQEYPAFTLDNGGLAALLGDV